MEFVVAEDHVPRQSADFIPTVWGDYFINNNSTPLDPASDSWMQGRMRELTEDVRVMFRKATDPVAKMHLIDMLQRLGISYHFRAEMDEALSFLSRSPMADVDDLHVVALRFRLLRQNRHNESSDVFTKFKDSEGNFKANLRSDANGLLSLYEAAYWSVPGEDILDEAIAFSQPLLQSMADHIAEPKLKAMVSSALATPIARKMTRLDAREYISICQDDKETRNHNAMLELAILDFHLLQLIYQSEIKNVCTWWQELGLAEKLHYARDRMVECYFWGFGMYPSPQCSREREFASKLYMLLSVCDDTFDIYGKPHELQKFNDLIQRWDAEGVDELPGYMKPLFVAIMNFFRDAEGELVRQGKEDCVPYIREAMKKQIASYYTESKWACEGYVPTLEEYLRVSLVSTCYPAATCVSYVGLEEEATKEMFEWAIKIPKILQEASIMGRIYNDVVTHEFEQKRVHVASAVECCAKDHGVTVAEAYQKLSEKNEHSWRSLNREYLQIARIPTSVLAPIVNLAHLSLTVYKYLDGYTNSNTFTKEMIESMFVNLISIRQG